MGNMFVTRCEYIYHKRVLEYYAYSSLFEPVEKGEKPPIYYIVTEKQEDSIVVTASLK